MRFILLVLITFATVSCESSTIVTTNVTNPFSPTPVSYQTQPVTYNPNPTTPCSSTPVGQTCNQNPTNPVTRAPDIGTFSADSFRINHPNIPVILRWDTSDFNATVRIDPGVGSVGPVGFAVVFPTATTTYTLTARNNFGIAQRTLTIVVNAG